jgi:threonine aldolase
VLNWFKSQLGKADQVVEEWHEGANFYRKYASGFIEQGGFKAQGAGCYVTLFKSFSSTDYSVVATVYARESDGAEGTAQASAQDANRFFVRTRSAGITYDDPCYWYAFGY